jgi:hypothetical protein
MIEEMIHRNAMFCARHAEEIAQVSMETPEVEDLGDGLYRIRIDLVNSQLMPSRSGMAAEHHIGTPDIVEISGDDLQVLAAGTMRNRFHPERMDATVLEPARLRLENGVPGHGRITASWLVRGSGQFTVRYSAEKADSVEETGIL